MSWTPSSPAAAAWSAKPAPDVGGDFADQDFTAEGFEVGASEPLLSAPTPAYHPPAAAVGDFAFVAQDFTAEGFDVLPWEPVLPAPGSSWSGKAAAPRVGPPGAAFSVFAFDPRAFLVAGWQKRLLPLVPSYAPEPLNSVRDFVVADFTEEGFNVSGPWFALDVLKPGVWFVLLTPSGSWTVVPVPAGVWISPPAAPTP